MIRKSFFVLGAIYLASATTIGRRYNIAATKTTKPNLGIDQPGSDESPHQITHILPPQNRVFEEEAPPSGFRVAYGPYTSPQVFYPHLQGQPQGYPVQPQILYYSVPGQSFLVNPGNPPGNFLIPTQPIDPNVYRSPQPQPAFPQTPIFVGGNPAVPRTPDASSGHPRQPFVPTIEKDAEEIPKNTPQQGSALPSLANVPHLPGISGPPLRIPGAKKPQKIEFDEEADEDTTKAPVAPRKDIFNVRPGQRFFILNGQQLFGSYPQLEYYQQPGFGPEPFHQRQALPQVEPQQFKRFGPPANIILRNQPHLLQQHLVPADYKGINFPQETNGLPITLHNQVVANKDGVQSVVLTDVPQSGTKAISSAKEGVQLRYLEKGLPLDHVPIFDTPRLEYDYYKYGDDASDGAIIVDAKYQEPNEVEADDTEKATERPVESTLAEAHPGAVALAGVGGVAAAGPKGIALAGQGGLAVSSPHATAVAGPSKDETGAVSVKPTSSANKDKEQQKEGNNVKQ